MNRRKRTAAIVAAAAFAFTVSGCSGTASTPAAESPPSSPAPWAPTVPAPATTNDVAVVNAPHAFGETVVWEDGIRVTVEDLGAAHPGQYAVKSDKSAAYRAFKVTFTNGTEQNYDPRSIYPTLTSGGVEGSRFFEVASGVLGPPSTTIRPGRTVTFKVGYGAADPADMLMEVNIGGVDKADAG